MIDEQGNAAYRTIFIILAISAVLAGAFALLLLWYVRKHPSGEEAAGEGEAAEAGEGAVEAKRAEGAKDAEGVKAAGESEAAADAASKSAVAGTSPA